MQPYSFRYCYTTTGFTRIRVFAYLYKSFYLMVENYPFATEALFQIKLLIV
jgi:hypothetical protein